MILQGKDKFTLDNTKGFNSYALNLMNMELAEDLEFISNQKEPYERFVRHDKWRILQKYSVKFNINIE